MERLLVVVPLVVVVCSVRAVSRLPPWTYLENEAERTVGFWFVCVSAIGVGQGCGTAWTKTRPASSSWPCWTCALVLRCCCPMSLWGCECSRIQERRRRNGIITIHTPPPSSNPVDQKIHKDQGPSCMVHTARAPPHLSDNALSAPFPATGAVGHTRRPPGAQQPCVITLSS